MRKLVDLLLITFFAFSSSSAEGQTPKAEATIPDGHVSIGSTLGGSYVVTIPLKKKYDVLITRAKTLKGQITNQTIDEVSARRELREIQMELKKIAQQIEDTKQLVAAAKVHSRKQVVRMPLGSKRLLIRAAKVRVVGWDKPFVEYVLEKIVLSVDGEGVEEDFEGIKVVQRSGILPNDVGYTSQQNIDRFKVDADKPNPLAERLAIESDRRFSPFHSVQGKGIDVIQVEGLLYAQGNRQISIELRGKTAISSSSHWRRHSNLTVYVPSCEWLGIRGGREGVTIDSLDGSLSIVGDDDIDYDAKSRIRNVTGDFNSSGITLHEVDEVGGNVSIRQTEFHENSSTHYSGNSRTFYTGEASTQSYTNIAGNLRLTLTRADVTISQLGGELDINNDFGNTSFESPSLLATGHHRLVSQAGNINAKIPRDKLEGISVMALTEAGVVKCTNVSRQFMQDRNITTFTEPGPARRNWKGFTTDIPLFNLANRINTSLTRTAGHAGIDIISRAGRIDLEFTK